MSKYHVCWKKSFEIEVKIEVKTSENDGETDEIEGFETIKIFDDLGEADAYLTDLTKLSQTLSANVFLDSVVNYLF